jgi:SPP1 family predicted phage head-tail adaptor
VKIGIKRHRIDLQRATKAQTNTGAIERTWATFGRVWADVNPLRGDEAQAAMQLEARTTHRIRMRRTPASATLTPADRIAWGGRLFEITGVIDIAERQREIEVIAAEVTA